ncbi:class I SAM-dependent methyltransferase [uncultured Paraglaciecola sp.]|uniref:class I SAM-dependent methyltransferase n=1 Tax=uncultured Paraglaciecola sp. TaxID=1765024 RepID=UPI00260C82B7|nr:class I SAM-dependent methyltransferase [uncultured Paraglaciecola sp.]
MKCRHCHHALQHRFVDLGFAPPSNAYLTTEDLDKPEVYLPLQVYVCDQCWLVQTQDYIQPEKLFQPEYAYFSSVSKSWLQHAQRYADMIIAREKLSKDNLVIEIAANDGYLLKNFVERDIPCLGIEPALATAEKATAVGIPVITEFFTQALAQKLAAEQQMADLIIGNNVLAHVPDISDFVAGLKILLKPTGSITMEFPHLLELINNNQFDTIYHEHFSYLSLTAVIRIFDQAALKIVDVEQLPTHGGSLRIYACHKGESRQAQPTIKKLLHLEVEQGLQQLGTYLAFQSRVDKIKDDLLMFLIEQKRLNKKVIGYGAAAKGNTLLNYAGIKPDLLPVICDAAPSKQNMFMPGSHIPIASPVCLEQQQPDFILILPWNIKAEVSSFCKNTLPTSAEFVTAIPTINRFS